MSFRRSLLLIPVLCTVFVFHGCVSSGYSSKNATVQFLYSLETPQKSSTLAFRDNDINISFHIDASALNLQLNNVSSNSISVLWEKATIGINNRFYPIRNGSTFYTTEKLSPTAVLLPPAGYIRDLVVPRDNITAQKTEWVEKNLIPFSKIYIGSKVSLLLPILSSGTVREYLFTFRIKDLTPRTVAARPMLNNRPPAPPPPTREMTMKEYIIPFAIVGGVLGVSVLLLSQKKTPAIIE